MISWVVLFLLVVYIFTVWERFIPDSYIPHRTIAYHIELPSDSPRHFDICNDDLLSELDELDNFKDTYSFFIRGYTCRVFIIYDSEVVYGDLILFGNNTLNWDSESYILCDSEVYFPKPGSVLINSSPKIYYGRPIRIVVGDFTK